MSVNKPARVYSFSDRIRYYWPDAEINAAIDTLMDNLSVKPIPLPLLSQYLPYQFTQFREGMIDYADRLNLCYCENS